MLSNTLIKAISKLPSHLVYQGIIFEFQIVNDTSDGVPSVAIIYNIIDVFEESQHWDSVSEYHSWVNPFYDNAIQGFLYLVENITDDVTLLDELDGLHTWLTKNKIVEV